MHLFELGAAFLGWPPSEVWTCHLAEIVIATEAKVRFESPPPKKVDTASEISTKMDAMAKRMEEKFGNTGN